MSEFDSYAPRYEEMLRDPLRDTFSSGSAFFHRRKWQLIREFFASRQQDTKKMSWLDVGCGQGELLELGVSSFGRAAGCDPSCSMLKGARVERSSPIEAHMQASPSQLPFPDQSFDFVTAVCVYHHVHGRNRELLTQSVRRILRPGGVFCIIEHNPWNPATRAIVKRCPVDVDAELLSAPVTKRLLRAGLFDPIHTSYFLYLPETLYKPLSWVESALKNAPAGGQYAVFSQTK